MNDALMAPNATKQARDFRRLVRKLFEIGAPTVELLGGRGDLRVVAIFGGHRVLLGAFQGGEEVDGVLRLAMQVRATLPGAFKSTALAEAFAASGPIEVGGDEAEVCDYCGEDLDDATKSCAGPAAAAMVRAEVEAEERGDYEGDDLDGDHASALASAGFGTDEDYGGGDACL